MAIRLTDNDIKILKVLDKVSEGIKRPKLTKKVNLTKESMHISLKRMKENKVVTIRDIPKHVGNPQWITITKKGKEIIKL